MTGRGKRKPGTELQEPEYSKTSSANEMIIIPGTKRKAVDEGPTAKNKDATGGKKSRNYALEREKEKITKKMKRQLAAVQQRKARKLTQEELFASLAEYQLDTKVVQQLSSTIHAQDKHQITPQEEVEFPNKLKSLGKKAAQPKTIHQKERVQENYYPTDDESSEEEAEPVEEKEASRPDITTHREVVLEEPKIRKRTKKSKILMNRSSAVEVDDDEDEETVANAPREPVLRRKKCHSAGDLPIEAQEPTTSQEDKEIKEEPVDPTVSPRKYILVERDPEIEKKRAELPIYAEEVPIVEAINENIVTVVCGETGSGKTTQIPQFLYEAGYASQGQMIGITEPRRVAAMSMAQRVGEELGLPEAVSYQIRYEGTRSEKTKILFMTDGVLMKEMENDIMLKKYSAILIDEAHERSMYSDVLIGMLSRIAPLRAKTPNPLKLIIMSATLRLQDFLHERLFPSIQPKVIKVNARQFPVAVHFEKKTPGNYMAAAFRKTCRIHEALPDGTILIFVSGQQEVRELIDKLKARYPIRYEKTKTGEVLVKGSKKWKQARKEAAQNIKLEDFKEDRPETKEALDGEDLLESGVGGDAWDDFDEVFISEEDPIISTLPPPPSNAAPLYCLPLFSLLSTEKQKRVFEPAPEGARMCVVATNVAETSLTIPGVKYVVDTGFEKRRLYDPITGVSQFVVAHVSQASSEQRSGRSGRVAAGHAYRLYSSAVFADFEQFSRPEIMDKPADQLVLHLKSMNIVKVVNFPFPSAPEPEVLEAAESRLVKLGALAVTTRNEKTEARITQLGKTLSVFPLAPAYAKVIAMANQQGLLPHAISLISALSVREPLVPVSSLRGATEEETKTQMTEVLKLRRSWCGKGPARRLGDILVLLKAVTASEEAKMDPSGCARLGLRHKAMLEIRRLRVQLTNIVNSSFKLTEGIEMTRELAPPTDAQAQMLRQMLVAGLADRVAKRVDRAVTDEEIPRGAYQTTKLREYVFIDPCSVIYTEEPDFVIYQDIVQLGDRKCMQTIMTVDHEWLQRLAESHCLFGAQDKDQEPRYDGEKDEIVRSVTVTFGSLEWKLDPVDRPIPRDIMLYRYFAMYFLQGVILPKLTEYAPKMLAPATTMVRSWAKLQKRTEALLNKLVDKDVHTRASLIEAFHQDENFLLEEYLQWVPESLHPAVTLMWPPLEEKTAKMGRNKFYSTARN